MLRLAATLHHPGGWHDRLWWEVPDAFADHLTAWADPWVVGLIFPMMQGGAPVHIEGRVSPSLLANLELFMKIWECWEPGRYRPVSLSADSEIELPPVPQPGATLASFSGGVDSCFTLFRHRKGLAGRRSRRITAAVVQHGLDVWLDRPNTDGVYLEMLAGVRAMLDSMDVRCIPMRTNFQTMRLNWSDAWGTQLASGLNLLAGRYDTALLANDMPYRWLNMSWPHHPVTVPLLGGRGMTLIDDGGESSRVQKAKLISDWPEAMRHLHVCFGLDEPEKYENCCRCEKCVRTILAFRIAGCPRPAAFQVDPSDDDIRRVRLTLVTRLKRWTELAREAEAAGLGATGWTKAIRSVIRRYRWRQFREPFQRPFIPLRNAIRWLTRGTDSSRRQIANDRAKATAPVSHRPIPPS
ncbi:MAG: hypothetical protein IT536_03565 [Hyphomicrobiales bacterium]|nr:hypothetical protein [Hyphomicrobiales bacterium]